jgi:hypothetical protein
MHAEKAPLMLTEVGARRLTDRIRQQLATVDEDLARAWECGAWQLLGHESWAAYCAAEFTDLTHVKLAVSARQERVKALRLVGASERAIASATGVSPAAVHADLVELRRRGELDDTEATVTGLDGKRRDATQPATGMAAREVAQTERHGLTILMHEAWQRVDATGEDGLTCLELEKRAKWRHTRASSLLNRLENWPAGALVEKTDVKRDGYRAYRSLPLD